MGLEFGLGRIKAERFFGVNQRLVDIPARLFYDREVIQQFIIIRVQFRGRIEPEITRVEHALLEVHLAPLEPGVEITRLGRNTAFIISRGPVEVADMMFQDV